MNINNSALITDTFKCPNPAFAASNMQLPYKVCIGRQIAKTPYGEMLYQPCADCKNGKDIRRHFKDYQYIDKTVKINTKNATGKRVKKGKSPYSPHYVGNNPNKTFPVDREEGEGDSMAAREKPRCEVAGCPKGQWRERRCMVHFNEKHGIVKTGKFHKIAKKPVPINKQCSVKGCGKYAVKDGKCIRCFKESLAGKHQESKKQIKAEPEIKNVIPWLDRGIQAKDNGKIAAFAQLLYASDLLDGQIESSLDSGIVDTNILINIRKRIGEVLRGNLHVGAEPMCSPTQLMKVQP